MNGQPDCAPGSPRDRRSRRIYKARERKKARPPKGAGGKCLGRARARVSACRSA